jgi:hypothetical protein
VRYIPANGRIDNMVETDTNVFILKFKVDKSVGVASGGDFNAENAEFRRSVSQGFEWWDVFSRGYFERTAWTVWATFSKCRPKFS